MNLYEPKNIWNFQFSHIEDKHHEDFKFMLIPISIEKIDS